MNKKSKLRSIVVCIAFVYAFLAQFAFADICEYFGAIPGYQCAAVQPWELVIFAIAAGIPSLLLPINGARSSGVLLWIVYYTHIIPAIILYPLFFTLDYDFAFPWVSMVIGVYILVAVGYKKINISLPKISISATNMNLLLISMLIVAIGMIVSVFGVNFVLPSVDDVYEVRSEFKNILLNSQSILVGYIVIAGGFLLAPLSLVAGIYRFKRDFWSSLLLIALSLVVSYIIYGSGGFKSIAFSSFVCILVYFMGSRESNFDLMFAIGLPVVVLLAFLASFIPNMEIIFYHWVRRIFMVPGMHAVRYFEYMLTTDLWFLNSAPSVLSEYYYGTQGSANAGLIGDGFVKGRFFGVLLNGALFALMLSIADVCSRSIDRRVSAALFCLSAYTIANSALTTVLLSYGFIFLCLLFYAGSASYLRK